SGERRYRATKLAGLPTIECHFHEGELTKSDILEQQLIENLLREDLRPIEEAKAFVQLLELNGWTGKELAEALRVNPSKITRALALLKLPEDIQGLVESGELSSRAAYELTKLASPEQQRAVLEKRDSDSGEITIAAVQKQVRQRKGKPAAEPRGVRQVFFAEGYKVTVTSPKKGNYFEIEQALLLALDEVRLRLNNNVQL